MKNSDVTIEPPTSRNESSGRMKWFVIGSICLLPFIYFGLGSIDASKADYSAVTPVVRAEPLEKENAIFYLNQITQYEHFDNPWMNELNSHFDQDGVENIFHPNHQWDEAYWKTVLEDRAEDLALLKRAYNAPDFYDKPVYDMSHSKPDVIYILSKSRIFTVEILDHIVLVQRESYERG